MKASEILTKEKAKRARDIIGGLHGEVSTRETVRLRAEYTAYAADAQSEGRDPEPFAEWARKRKKKD